MLWLRRFCGCTIRIPSADGVLSRAAMCCAKSMESCFHALTRLRMEIFFGRISESTSRAARRFPSGNLSKRHGQAAIQMASLIG